MPKVVDHEERRQAFASAAIDVIARKGIDSARLVDVARAAGVTTGSLGHYFEDKDDVFDSALEQLVASWDAQLTIGDGALIDVLCRFLPLDEESSRDARVWLTFHARSLLSDPVAEKVSSYWEKYAERLAKHLCSHEGKDPDEARILAVTIGAVVDGMIARALADPDSWPASRQRAQLESALLQLVGPGALKDRTVD